jgi:hypothetical protein
VKITRLLLSVAALMVLLGSDVSRLSAGVLTFNPATGGSGANFNQSVGWQFNVLSPITVTDLEWFDPTGTGLNLAHTVGIWNPAGGLVTSAMIPAGAAAGLDGMFRFVLVTPVALPVGSGYIVGGENFAASTDRLACGSGDGGSCDGLLTQTLDARLSFVNATFGGPGFTRPTFFSSAHEGFYGPSFSVVPEPSTMLLLGIGLLMFGVLLRRRSKEDKDSQSATN